VIAIADPIVKREVLSVLFAQDFSRRWLGIIARLYRFNAQLAFPVVKNAKQIACDRIACFDDLARIKLIWIGPPYRATHAVGRRLRAALAWAAGAEEVASLRSASSPRRLCSGRIQPAEAGLTVPARTRAASGGTGTGYGHRLEDR
jgi:hypothetical protein